MAQFGEMMSTYDTVIIVFNENQFRYMYTSEKNIIVIQLVQ